ncbi:hypothetical protein QR680_009542 [Steinernema hermaphroditum]|uniref:MULE transposase domain-containing protein n=1 Tax=Steinernema hermaphroditum TaxID=289476 RepID=A0AA39M926_9BILA|nr:hypothetical protein QR680_009542 [Steinernema hermaphroditum]
MIRHEIHPKARGMIGTTLALGRTIRRRRAAALDQTKLPSAKSLTELSLNSCIPSTIGLAKAGQLYCLLRNKKKETYIILLRAVQRLAPSFNPSSVMLDYEFGAMSAFEEVFPQIRVSGCFFHLANSQRKRVKDGLKLAICKDANLDLQVRMVRAMALVPKTHVMDVWGELIAQLDPRLDLMRKWFETYVGRLPLRGANRPLFSHDKWNVFARLMSDQPRTNNSVEAYHSALSKFYHLGLLGLLGYLSLIIHGRCRSSLRLI